jgi:hypothetical protein
MPIVAEIFLRRDLANRLRQQGHQVLDFPGHLGGYREFQRLGTSKVMG